MPTNRATINAFLRELEGPVKRAFSEAVNSAKGRANITQLVAAIESGNVDAIMAASGFSEGMWAGMTEQIRSAYAKGGAFALTNSVPKKYGMTFNINNPRAETWLRNNSSQLITGSLRTQQIEAIQTMLQSGMARGANPRSMALDIVGRISKETGRRAGGVIGLSGPQAKALDHMRDILKNDPRAYFIKDRLTGKMNPRFTLADRRFNSTIEKAIASKTPIPAAMREKIAARYEDRLLKHRGDTIGRTEALRAMNESADEALRQVVDEGLAPSNSIVRIWRHSFSQNEREGHLMMDGTEARLDEYFTNPLTGAVLKYPGDGGPEETINCRCWVEQQIDFVAVETGKPSAPVAPKPPRAPSKPRKPRSAAKQAAATRAATPKPPPAPTFAENLSMGEGATTETTGEIFNGLRKQIPSAAGRISQVETVLKNRKLATVFVDDFETAYIRQKEIFNYAQKKWGKLPTQAARITTKPITPEGGKIMGLASPMWRFTIAVSRGSMVEKMSAEIALIRDTVKKGILAVNDSKPYYMPGNVGNASGIANWLHEMGHQMHTVAGRAFIYGQSQAAKTTGSKLWAAVSRYAETNDYEFVAEHFVAWLVDYDNLLASRRAIAEMMDEIMDAAVKRSTEGALF